MAFELKFFNSLCVGGARFFLIVVAVVGKCCYEFGGSFSYLGNRLKAYFRWPGPFEVRGEFL